MAGENPRTRTGERGDAVSDTPRTDASAFGTDNEILNRLFWIRELPRYVVPVDFARTLEREIAAVTADLCAFAVDMEKQLSASEQETRRLREALQRAMDEYDNGGKCWHSNEVAGAMRAALAEKARMPLVA